MLTVVLFMAHQDVVPVPNVTVGDWKYPPFSGYYDGERVWGRGIPLQYWSDVRGDGLQK
jgi:Gly-Xaa carboxypeptidase